MAETILLAYKAASLTGVKHLVGNNDLRVSVLVVDPSGYLGISEVSSTSFLSVSPLSSGTWYQLAVTIDPSTKAVEYFVNGYSVGSKTVTSMLPDYRAKHIGNGARLAPSQTLAPSSTLAPGSPTGTTLYANGTIDEVQRHNSILTPANILALSQSTLYAPLPSLVLQDGYSEVEFDGAIRTSIEGAVKRRIRYTGTPTTLTASMPMSPVQTTELDYFWKYTLRRGTIPFLFPDPTDPSSGIEVYMLGAPSYSVKGGGSYYVASFELEVVA